MKIARVTGTVVSTVKYEKYRGLKMLKVRHLTLEGCLLYTSGEYATSMEMAGASISLLRVDAELKKYLSAAANTPFFKQFSL